MINSIITKSILMLLSGALLSLAAPGNDIWILAWIGIIPLLLALNTSNRFYEVILYSFLFGFSYTLIYERWLISIHPLTWLGVSNIESLILAFISTIVPTIQNSILFILFGLFYYSLKLILGNNFNKTIPNISLISLVWVVIFNKVGSWEIFLGFPWTLIEYSQYKNIYLIQVADILGSSFISFLIVFFNITLSNLASWYLSVDRIGAKRIHKNPGEIDKIIVDLSFIGTIIFFCIIYSIFITSNFTPDSKAKITLLQPNLPISETRGKDINVDISKKRYEELLGKEIGEIIISPEGSLPTAINIDKNTRAWVSNISDKYDCDILFGTYKLHIKSLLNSAVAFNKESKEFNYYEKERLVPFGEYIPLYSILPAPLKKLADFTIGNGFIKGKNTEPVKLSTLTVGTSICFELIFPKIIRSSSTKDTDFLVNLSDLSWFSNDLIRKQFISFGVFRSIENRKSLVIATNNGISSLISPTGKIIKQSESKKSTITSDFIDLNKKTTIYTKYGW